MRTKALLGLAVIAASALTAAAQNVYSLNVVGYYNIPVPANQFMLIANQLKATDNTLGALMPAAEDGAQFFKFSGAYTTCLFDGLEGKWDKPEVTLNPGEGGFFKSPVATTLTFVGEVMQGSQTNTLPINAFAIRSSIVPQAGGVTALLGLPAEDGDQLFKMANGQYQTFLYDGLSNAWDPSDPTIAVGESFFFKKASTSTQSQWIRNFTVQ